MESKTRGGSEAYGHSLYHTHTPTPTHRDRHTHTLTHSELTERDEEYEEEEGGMRTHQTVGVFPSTCF